jgi:hypothetical protein
MMVTSVRSETQQLYLLAGNIAALAAPAAGKALGLSVLKDEVTWHSWH